MPNVSGGGWEMICERVAGVGVLSLLLLGFLGITIAPASGNPAELASAMAVPAQHDQHAQHGQGDHHHLHLPMGEEKCAPKFTYEEGPLCPVHWPGICTTGNMQAPIDIRGAEKLRIAIPKFNYKAADLDIINDCNQYRILVKFPDNYWLTVGKKPYFLSELHFREPGENAVNGQRPRMSVQLVHFSVEGVFLIIEIPVVAGKENPVIKTLWEHIPSPGKENKVQGIK